MQALDLKFLCFVQLLALAACADTGDRCLDTKGQSGVCTAISQCSTAQNDLKNGIRPKNCGFEGRQPIVCCPDDTLTESTSPRQPRQPGDKANAWCEEFSKSCPEVAIAPVAGGTPALPDEFPHMAAVGYGPQSKIQWKCGGSLISDNFVLTAAHCLHSGGDGPAEWVLLGTVNLAANETFLGDTGQIHKVIRRIRHPGYTPPAKYDDVALLEIGPALTKNPRPLRDPKLHPACLSTTDSFRYYSYFATGWGRTGFAEDPSLELLKVELDVFDEAKCNETFEDVIRTTSLLKKGIDSTMLCAGILKGGKDTCQGDSGGPLQVDIRGGCQFDVWGITSFGKVCSFADSPSVYMKVSAYVGWIEENVWPT